MFSWWVLRGSLSLRPGCGKHLSGCPSQVQIHVWMGADIVSSFQWCMCVEFEQSSVTQGHRQPPVPPSDMGPSPLTHPGLDKGVSVQGGLQLELRPHRAQLSLPHRDHLSLPRLLGHPTACLQASLRSGVSSHHCPTCPFSGPNCSVLSLATASVSVSHRATSSTPAQTLERNRSCSLGHSFNQRNPE